MQTCMFAVIYLLKIIYFIQQNNGILVLKLTSMSTFCSYNHDDDSKNYYYGMMHVRLIPALTRTIYGSNLLKTFKIASPGYSNRATFRCFPGMSSKNSKSENKSKKEETNDSLSSNKDSPPPWVTRSKVSIDIQSERGNVTLSQRFH